MSILLLFLFLLFYHNLFSSFFGYKCVCLLNSLCAVFKNAAWFVVYKDLTVQPINQQLVAETVVESVEGNQQYL